MAYRVNQMPSRMTLNKKFKKLPLKNKPGRRKKLNFSRMLIRLKKSVANYKSR